MITKFSPYQYKINQNVMQKLKMYITTDFAFNRNKIYLMKNFIMQTASINLRA